MNTQIQLTEQELATIIAQRNAVKSEAQIRYEGLVESAKKQVIKELSNKQKSYDNTMKVFSKLQSAKNTLDFKVIESEVFCTPYQYQIEEIKEDLSAKTLVATITLSYVDEKGKSVTINLSISGDKIEVPYYFKTGNRYSQTLVISSFIKRVTEVIKDKTAEVVRARAYEVGFGQLVKRLRAESPEGTVFSRGEEYKRSSMHSTDCYTINYLKIEYSNGNSVKVRVYNDHSLSMISKVDVTTEKFKTEDWMNYLKG